MYQAHQSFPGGSDGKENACNAGDLGSTLGWDDPLEKGMATHSSILAWRIPWTEEPGGLQSMGSRESEMTEGLTLSLSLLILPLSVLLISSHLDRFSLIYLFIHSLIHSSTQKIFIEHLLYARQYSKGQRYQIEKKK